MHKEAAFRAEGPAPSVAGGLPAVAAVALGMLRRGPWGKRDGGALESVMGHYHSLGAWLGGLLVTAPAPYFLRK